jgi:hypothetical protein
MERIQCIDVSAAAPGHWWSHSHRYFHDMISVTEERALFQPLGLGIPCPVSGTLAPEESNIFQAQADAAARADGPFVMYLPPMSLVSVQESRQNVTSAIARAVALVSNRTRPRFAIQRSQDEGASRKHFLHVELAPLRDLVFRGEQAAIEVSGLGSAIDISTAYASVFVFNSSAPVNIDVQEGGSVTWSGSTGPVTIRADCMLLKLLSADFQEMVTGTSGGKVSVFVPPLFKGSLFLDLSEAREVNLHAAGAPPPCFVEKHGSRRIVEVGAGRRVASLTSTFGDIDVYWGRN